MSPEDEKGRAEFHPQERDETLGLVLSGRGCPRLSCRRVFLLLGTGLVSWGCCLPVLELRLRTADGSRQTAKLA